MAAVALGVDLVEAAWTGIAEVQELQRFTNLAKTSVFSQMRRSLDEIPILDLAKSRDVILSRSMTLKKYKEESLGIFSSAHRGSEYTFVRTFSQHVQGEVMRLAQEGNPFPENFQWARDLFHDTHGLHKDTKLSKRATEIYERAHRVMQSRVEAIDEMFSLHQQVKQEIDDPSFLQKQAHLSVQRSHLLNEMERIRHQFHQSLSPLEDRITVAKGEIHSLLTQSFENPNHLREIRQTLDKFSALSQRDVSVFRRMEGGVRVHLLKAGDAFGLPRGMPLDLPQARWDRLYEDFPADPLTYRDFDPLSFEATNTNPMGRQLFSGERLRAWEGYQQTQRAPDVVAAGGAAAI